MKLSKGLNREVLSATDKLAFAASVQLGQPFASVLAVSFGRVPAFPQLRHVETLHCLQLEGVWGRSVRHSKLSKNGSALTLYSSFAACASCFAGSPKARRRAASRPATTNSDANQ